MTDFEVTEEMVMALADGELESDKEEAVRAAIKQDPSLQKLYEDMILTRDALIQTYGNLTEDDTYKELVAQIKREGAETRDLPPKSENVIWVNFTKLNLGVPELSRIAASLAVGLFAGGIFTNAYLLQTVDVLPEIMQDNSQNRMLAMRGVSKLRETSSDESEVLQKLSEMCDSYECFFNDLGVKFENDGKTLIAKSLYEAAIQANPKAPAPYAGLGDVYYSMKNFQKSAENFEIFLDIVKGENQLFPSHVIDKYKDKLAISKKNIE